MLQLTDASMKLFEALDAWITLINNNSRFKSVIWYKKGCINDESIIDSTIFPKKKNSLVSYWIYHYNPKRIIAITNVWTGTNWLYQIPQTKAEILMTDFNSDPLTKKQ